MLPLTPGFTTELAFYLVAGHVICTYVLLPAGTRFETTLTAAFTNALWVSLATGRIELALAELLCFWLTDTLGSSIRFGSSTWHGIHLLHKLFWFVCVVWLGIR